MTRSALILATLAALLAGCTQFPQLDRTISPAAAAADYPELVPVGPLLARAEAGRVNVPATQANLEGRVARLKARAARLRGTVLSGREKQRLQEGLR